MSELLSFGTLSHEKQLFITVHASDVHNLRGSDAHSTTGTSVLATTGLSGSHPTKSRNTIVSACASDLEAAELVPIDKNGAQFVLQNHFQEGIARRGDCPTILVVVVNNQTMSQGCISELAVVVGVASAAILNALHIICSSEPSRAGGWLQPLQWVGRGFLLRC